MTVAPLFVRGASVMDAAGRFAARPVYVGAGGRFAHSPVATTAELDATGLWMIPGVYDCHCHITWSDFHDEQRRAKPNAQRAAETEAALFATLLAGVTSLRDAGGADSTLRSRIELGELRGPRLHVAVDMLGAAHAGTADTMRRHVENALAKGATWIKLVATAGVATPNDRLLDPVFTEAETKVAVETAREAGARVMVHTWGGRSADWAIEYGARSLEHGVHLTDRQLSAAAGAGMSLVPTLTIYRLVRDMVRSGELTGVALERADAVVAAHGRVVVAAHRAGLAICLGSDYGTTRQHGTNLAEIAALIRAGLPPADALLAATAQGARLLADPDGGAIAPGYRADAVLLNADPTDPATFDTTSTVAAVLVNGRIVRSSTTQHNGI